MLIQSETLVLLLTRSSLTVYVMGLHRQVLLTTTSWVMGLHWQVLLTTTSLFVAHMWSLHARWKIFHAIEAQQDRLLKGNGTWKLHSSVHIKFLYEKFDISFFVRFYWWNDQVVPYIIEHFPLYWLALTTSHWTRLSKIRIQSYWDLWSLVRFSFRTRTKIFLK